MKLIKFLKEPDYYGEPFELSIGFLPRYIQVLIFISPLLLMLILSTIKSLFYFFGIN